jgi:threonine/homoserine/homoserine lactone efflux protein
MITPILKGLLLGVLLSISIGPVIFAILKQSLTLGKKAGYAFVFGVSTSDMALLFVCNVFTRFFELVLKHKVIIALLGAGFLLLMGLYTLLFKKIHLETEDVHTGVIMRKRDYVKSYAAGFFMNTLNPSVFLFWFAWTAAIGADAADAASPMAYKLIVFGTCLLFVLVSDIAKVILAGALRPRLNDKNLLWINRISAIIILIFSAVLFYNAIRLL